MFALRVWRIRGRRSYWFRVLWNSTKCVALLVSMWRSIRAAVCHRWHRIAVDSTLFAALVSWKCLRRLWFRENQRQSLCRNNGRLFRSKRWFSIFASCRGRAVGSSTGWRKMGNLLFANRIPSIFRATITRSIGSCTQTISNGFPSASQFNVTLSPLSASTDMGLSLNIGASTMGRGNWIESIECITFACSPLTVHIQCGLCFADADFICCFALDYGAMMTAIHQINCLFEWKLYENGGMNWHVIRLRAIYHFCRVITNH